ncbi:peptidase S8/S53 domain-containing protein [Lactarius quietus]|nr:peptidase S8/S53 domain-containing protein [Lactarius quietus]
MDIPVSQVDDILGSSFQLYRNVETNFTILRTLSYSLPEVLHNGIQTVAPTTVAMEHTKARSEESVTVLPSPNVPVTVTPAYVRWQCKTMGHVPAAVDQNSLAIGGYIKQYPSPQDLSIFMKEFRTDGEDATFTIERVNGGEYDPSNPSRRAMRTSSPWVTSVGGTTDDEPEIAVRLSRGGFSDYFPRPPYQKQVVPRFLRHIGGMYEGLFFNNPGGRDLPDISAQAVNIMIVQNGKQEKWDGTSASGATPVRLLPSAIVRPREPADMFNGKKPLLNHWLYSDGLKGLNDIISGSNPGCNTTVRFPAVVGWDPVTVGTPDFDKLKDILVIDERK